MKCYQSNKYVNKLRAFALYIYEFSYKQRKKTKYTYEFWKNGFDEIKKVGWWFYDSKYLTIDDDNIWFYWLQGQFTHNCVSCFDEYHHLQFLMNSFCQGFVTLLRFP